MERKEKAEVGEIIGFAWELNQSLVDDQAVLV